MPASGFHHDIAARRQAAFEISPTGRGYNRLEDGQLGRGLSLKIKSNIQYILFHDDFCFGNSLNSRTLTSRVGPHLLLNGTILLRIWPCFLILRVISIAKLDNNRHENSISQFAAACCLAAFGGHETYFVGIRNSSHNRVMRQLRGSYMGRIPALIEGQMRFPHHSYFLLL